VKHLVGSTAVILLALGPHASAQTTLNLSATGEAYLTPDQITATLTAQASSRNPVTAQISVNTSMASALALAKTVPGITATTANYSVSQVQPDNGNGPATYTASEDLTLVEPAPLGTPDAAFGTLLGKLQSHALLLENFDGSLSQAASRHAMQAAIADAMSQIQTQAQAVATALNETVARTTTVTLNTNPPSPLPMAPRAMMMAAPVAAPANVAIQASVTATVDLAASESK
jgi:uncharacterized protein YggE